MKVVESRILREFLKLSNAKCALLVDKEGHMITKQGVTRSFDMDTISALVAGSFAATKEMARLLGEVEPGPITAVAMRRSAAPSSAARSSARSTASRAARSSGARSPSRRSTSLIASRPRAGRPGCPGPHYERFGARRSRRRARKKQPA